MRNADIFVFRNFIPFNQLVIRNLAFADLSYALLFNPAPTGGMELVKVNVLLVDGGF